MLCFFIEGTKIDFILPLSVASIGALLLSDAKLVFVPRVQRYFALQETGPSVELVLTVDFPRRSDTQSSFLKLASAQDWLGSLPISSNSASGNLAPSSQLARIG